MSRAKEGKRIIQRLEMRGNGPTKANNEENEPTEHIMRDVKL